MNNTKHRVIAALDASDIHSCISLDSLKDMREYLLDEEYSLNHIILNTEPCNFREDYNAPHSYSVIISFKEYHSYYTNAEGKWVVTETHPCISVSSLGGMELSHAEVLSTLMSKVINVVKSVELCKSEPVLVATPEQLATDEQVRKHTQNYNIVQVRLKYEIDALKAMRVGTIRNVKVEDCEVKTGVFEIVINVKTYIVKIYDNVWIVERTPNK